MDIELRPPKLAAIVGPTASGKTALAVSLRKAGLPFEVINCDASQLVRQLDVGTAKPTAEELAAVPHHLIDVVEPTEVVDAARYAQMVDRSVATIVAADRWPVLVGGTGLYHRAVVRGLAPLPSSIPSVRAALEQQANTQGLQTMHERLRAVDPVYAEATPANNRQRVLRALEVYEISGRAFSDFHAEHQSRPDRYPCLNIVVEPDLEIHRIRLSERAEAMAAPLLKEVTELLNQGIDPAAPGMQALGYRQAAQQILTEQIDVTALVQTLIQSHRRYAKRQRTWFRKVNNRIVHTSAVADQALIERLRNWFESTQ